jgi:hypothetical protein
MPACEEHETAKIKGSQILLHACVSAHCIEGVPLPPESMPVCCRFFL